MREFSYVNRTEALLTPEIVSLLTQIHEFRGKQKLYIQAKPDVLDNLKTLAILPTSTMIY